MTREELSNKFLSSNSNNYILQLPTSFGKTKLALQKAEQWYTEDCKILIVIPFLVLKDTWKDELKKWKYEKMLPNITFTTYISLPKHCGKHWDIFIADEVHHTSVRCRDAMKFLKVKHFIGLSATIKKDILEYYRWKFKPEIITVAVKDAIESEVLPEPRIILLPLSLDNTKVNQIIEKNMKKGGNITTISYVDRWKYRGYKGSLRMTCTQQQYYDDLSGLIEWYKQRGMSNAIMRNIWLHKAGERLKWLAKQKEELIKQLLSALKNYRVLTFCQSIEQSESLGCACINSKVGTANLDKFNAKKIKHISAVTMLDEGISPVDCKIGIFQMINSSQRVIVQREGRILRHKNPVLIFPYFKYTREEEIIKDIIQNSYQDIFSVDPTDIDTILFHIKSCQ